MYTNRLTLHSVHCMLHTMGITHSIVYIIKWTQMDTNCSIFKHFNCFCWLWKDMASTFRLSYRNFPTHNAPRYPLSSALCYFFKLSSAKQIANSFIYKTLFVNGKPVTAIGTNLPTFSGQSTFGWEAMFVKLL